MFLDFASAGFLLAFPRLLGASRGLKKATTMLALGKIGYSLLTRHEGGAVGVLTMKAHLALDAAGGAALAALPLLTKKQERPAVAACCVAAGLFDLAAAAVSDPRSRPVRVPGLNAGVTTRLPAKDAPQDAVSGEATLQETTFLDSLKFHLCVTGPTAAVGPIIRRPAVEWLAETFGFSTNAVQTLRALRDKYGSGPLMVGTPLRHQAIVLDPAHVRRILDGSPEPFATAEVTKQAALAHFEPKVSLISHGDERTERRRLNEGALEHTRAVHHLAVKMLPVVDEEAQNLWRKVETAGELGWDDFEDAWFCMVRRVVFGNSAREDRLLLHLMKELRANANLTFLKPIDPELRAELHRRIGNYLRRAEPGSLAAVLASRTTSPVSVPENQVPQWLFAFDAAAMATFRALALLTTHPEHLQRAREETTGNVVAAKPHRPFLRATVLESVRLWPTTPAILRQSTRPTEWENGIKPAHTSILIYAPFFHRDESRVPFAHAFHPDVWIEDDPEVQGDMPRDWTFVPFSGGPGVCPGRNLVLLLTSGMLAALLGDRILTFKDPERLPRENLPGLLDHFTLRFEVGRPIAASKPCPAQHPSAAR
jgi:cytochrome P450